MKKTAIDKEAIGKIAKAVSESLDIDPEEEMAAVEKINGMADVFNKLSDLMDSGDVVLFNHFKEIIQYGCDITSYIGEPFDPALLRGILGMAAAMSKNNTEVWANYTKVHAPVVNTNATKICSKNGKYDA